ncbi:MAG: hypothetical protein ACRDIF_04120, partial [Actinomycetota bacterium]
WGPSPLGREFRRGHWPLSRDARQPAKEAAVALVPKAAPTSATYYFVPHLAHRTRIYEFPVPWTDANWGVRGEGLHNPRDVEWIIVDLQLLGARDRAIFDRLLSEEFTLRSERQGIVVAERTAR